MKLRVQDTHSSITTSPSYRRHLPRRTPPLRWYSGSHPPAPRKQATGFAVRLYRRLHRSPASKSSPERQCNSTTKGATRINYWQNMVHANMYRQNAIKTYIKIIFWQYSTRVPYTDKPFEQTYQNPQASTKYWLVLVNGYCQIGYIYYTISSTHGDVSSVGLHPGAL